MAQPTNPLPKYIEEALESNLLLKQQELDIKLATQQLKEARGLFFPDVNAVSDFTLARGGRLISIPVGDLLNPVYNSLNQLTGTNQFPEIENVNEPFFLNRFHDTRLSIAQPLFNTDIYFGYRAQKALISVQEAKTEAYKQELKKEVKVAYFRYLQALDLINILESNQRLVQELLRVNRTLVDNDKATVDAVYRTQYEVSALEAELATAKEQVMVAQSYFNFLLNRSLQSPIEVYTSQLTQAGATPELSISIDQALLKRQELTQLRGALSAQKELVTLERASRLPRASVGVLAGYQGLDYRFTGDEDYQLVQFNFTLPLFSGLQRKSRIQQARINAKQAEVQLSELEQRIRLQVIQAQMALQSALEEQEAIDDQVKSAEKVYTIKRSQYEQNQLLLVDLIDAQTQWFTAQQQQTIAYANVRIRLAEYERSLAL
ncbi:MAG: TolC family protein [Bacteroidota bacterium]